QTPHYVHRALAKVLELPAARIRVIATPSGGGFGGKSDPFNHEIAVAKLAMITGRPVKITLTREEVFYCHRGRHPTLMWVRTGVKKDGAITGMHFRSLLDGGAYGSYGVASTYYTGALQTVTYNIPRYHFQGARAFTNKAPCGPNRRHGTPQPRFAVVTADTDLTPVDLGSYSSRVTLMSGNAALQAAERARQILAVHAAKQLEVPVERLVFVEGRVCDSSDRKRGMSFAEAVQLAEAAEGTVGTVGSYTPPQSAGRYRGAGVGPSPAYSYSACVAEVDVDPETGIVRVPTI